MLSIIATIGQAIILAFVLVGHDLKLVSDDMRNGAIALFGPGIVASGQAVTRGMIAKANAKQSALLTQAMSQTTAAQTDQLKELVAEATAEALKNHFDKKDTP